MPTITVTTAATKIADSSSETREVRVHNRGTGVLYIGKDSSSLTTTDAFEIAADGEEDVTLEMGEQLFAITATSTADVDVD